LEDSGKLAKLLSQNDTLHTYNEQPWEFLANAIRDFVDDLDKEVFAVAQATLFKKHVKKGSRITAIFSSQPLLRMFVQTWKLSDYYPSTILFKPTWLKNNLLQHSGAVSILI
jgi:hypothetical protein